MRPFLAYIMPVETGGPVDPGFGVGSPGSPGGPGGPGGGLGIWGGPFDPPRPTHPIAPGGRPPGIWGGPPLYPDIGGPGPQPPTGVPPGIWGPPQMPPGFWGGGMGPGVQPQPHPDHTLPKPPDPVEPPVEWKAVWHPTEGWVVVGVPTVPVPTPSA
jgi:hypothetical protein